MSVSVRLRLLPEAWAVGVGAVQVCVCVCVCLRACRGGVHVNLQPSINPLLTIIHHLLRYISIEY
jgi:hypothetical protein